MLVMEYMEMGSLYDILHNETMVLEGELVLPILRDVTQGMRFLHAASPQVIHGDLKALNVLVDSKFRAKVCDFGLSGKEHMGVTGTPLWMAPELLRGESDNTAASDVYSFGIILYEVYSRQDPYRGEDMTEVLIQVADPSVNKRPPVPPSCPPLIASLMSDCLVADPADRKTFEELDLRIKRLHVSSVEPGKMRLSWQTKKEHRKCDLLNDMFPKHVAEALREGRKVEPESRDCVTIFFSDIVGFTTIASTMSPMKVSDMLDRLYLRFDMLSHKHDVFKVETIGDAYMAATNLVKDQEDHVKRIAEFAIDAVEAASGTMIDVNDPAKGYVKVRIGFHSGPVVANVVGSRCPRYSLFGDTVNIAARMESTSQENRIQCSDRSAGILSLDYPEIRLASRGHIKVKGKGEIHTYWVNEDCFERAPGTNAKS
jgi:class 3 adenylate cyclase